MAIRKYDREKGTVCSLFRDGGYLINDQDQKVKFYSEDKPSIGDTVTLYGFYVYDRSFYGESFRVHHFYIVQSNQEKLRLMNLSDIQNNIEPLDMNDIETVFVNGNGNRLTVSDSAHQCLDKHNGAELKVLDSKQIQGKRQKQHMKTGLRKKPGLKK